MSLSKQKTPKSAKKIQNIAETPLSSQYETVVVSPGRSPTKGSLTGIGRTVKDGAADLHNCMDKWEVYNSRGLELLSQIANIKLQAMFGQEAGNSGAGSSLNQLPPELEPLCDKLLNLITSMEKLVKKMKTVTNGFQGVIELEKHYHQGELNPDPLFQTWPVTKFYDTAQELLNMYEHEMKLKRTLVENVAHVRERNSLMFYMSSWQHQPYIEERAKFLLESILQETGHR